MARRRFGLDLAAVAWVVDAADNVKLGRPSTVPDVTAWTDQTGGSQITDLQDLGGAALPGGVIEVDADGRFAFLGPDTVPDTVAVWLEVTGSGVGRQLAVATDVADLFRALTDLFAGGAAGDVLGFDATQLFGVAWRPPPVIVYAFSAAGALTAGPGQHAAVYNDTGRELTIRSVRASVGIPPQGAAVVVDVNKNGATVFTDQQNRPTIPPGATTSGKVTAINTPLLAAGEWLTVDIDQVGSTSPGSGLTVQIEAA